MERFHSVPFFWVFFGFGILVAFALFFLFFCSFFVLCTLKTFHKGSNWTHRAIKAAVSLLIFPKESWIATELCLYAHPA